MGHSYQARLSGTLHLAVWVDFGGTCNMPTTVLLCIGYIVQECVRVSHVCACVNGECERWSSDGIKR